MRRQENMVMGDWYIDIENNGPCKDKHLFYFTATFFVPLDYIL
jgi:hypothetical protein